MVNKIACRPSVSEKLRHVEVGEIQKGFCLVVREAEADGQRGEWNLG